jgi:uncharacterized Tic20 family protein
MKYEDLKILDELREKGSITEEEFQREKAKILNEQYNSADGERAFKKPLFDLEENTYLMLMHLSQLAGLVVPLIGFIIPVVLWLTNKDVNEKVDINGRNILNFMISYTIYAVILCITIIGIPLAVILGIVYVVFVIVASIKANNGESWKYPMTIEFIK